MAGLELLSDQGIRMDGRRPTELRKIECKIGGISSNADGSAFYQQGNTKVLVTVYGPHDITKRKSKVSGDSAIINCQYSTAPFSSGSRHKYQYDRRSQNITNVLKRTFEAAVLTSTYPGSQIDIFFLILYQDGGDLSACINAGTLALISAGIPLKDYVCACSAGFVSETPLIDVNQQESFMGGTELNLAILNKGETIVCDELTSRRHIDHLRKIRKIALQGCKDIHAILEAAVRKYSSEIS